jgi:hypothetical protein
MRIRAVVEFDMKFDVDLPSIEQLVQDYKKWRLVADATPENCIALVIKDLLENEHGGTAEYESASVTNLEIIEE